MIFDEWWSQYAPGIQPIVSQKALAKAAWEAAQKPLLDRIARLNDEFIIYQNAINRNR